MRGVNTLDQNKPRTYPGGRQALNVPQRRSSVPVRPQPLPEPKSTLTLTKEILFTKKNAVIGGSILLLVIALTITITLLRQQQLTNERNNAANAGRQVQDLEYQTVLPKGKSISDLGGWKRVSPNEAAPVFAYTDTIDGVSINVSQQPLPQSFIGDTETQITELAKVYNANTKIDAGPVKVYIGSSSRGPQSVIFTKNSLLVLIKSDNNISDAAWANYVRALN